MADAPKKLSTKDILAAARAQDAKAQGGGAASPSEPAAPEPAAPPPAAAEAPAPAPAAPKPAATPGAKPKSTADILAAARAEAARKAGGAAPAAAGEAPAPAAPKPAAAGGAPKSTADILAAARAQSAGKSSAPAPAEPAAEKPAGAKARPAAKAPAVAAAEAAGGPKLSVEEMLAAVRPGSVAAVEAPAVEGKKPETKKPEKPVLPPMPQRPAPAKKPQPVLAPAPDAMRRGIVSAVLLSPFILVAKLFATPFAAAWTMLTATTGIASLATARFMLPNVLTEPPRKFKIGPPTDYDIGTVATKWVAQYGIWVVHTDQYKGKNLIYALISVCTHLGCTPSWLEGEQKFKCPCHGSGFYITGVNFEGPAPRPLERAGITVAGDGMLEVDKSVKFQEEMGQWEDPNSYFEVAG